MSCELVSMAKIANNVCDEEEAQKPSLEKEKKKKLAHVLVVPWPAQGHINPMMHLSKQLAANGVIITFVNTQFNHDRIMQSQASHTGVQNLKSVDTEGDIRLVGVPDGLGYEEYVANMDIPKQAQALIDMEPLLVKLVEELQPPVTSIIADMFVISTLAVARHFGIPHVTFWTQSAASYATHVFFTQNHALLKEHFQDKEGDEKRKVITCIPGCPALRSYKEVPTFLQPCDPSDFIFSYLITSFQTTVFNAYVLMNTLEELEAESFSYIHTPNMLCIGPLLPFEFVIHATSSIVKPKKGNFMKLGTSFWVEDEEGCLLPWLNQQLPSSVLYISFGSTTHMSTQRVSEFAAGLEASGCPFLMVVRPKMMRDEASGDSLSFPDGFVDRMRDSGRAVFVAWAPQLEILAHPAIGGFLTHAGWNSTLESICRGVPMLCWPYFADQMLNARCIVHTWKIGLDFVMEEVVDKEKSTSGGDGDSDSSISISKDIDSNGNMIALVRLDPITSTEIRKQVHMLSLAAKKAYENPSHSRFNSLLDFLFG